MWKAFQDQAKHHEAFEKGNPTYFWLCLWKVPKLVSLKLTLKGTSLHCFHWLNKYKSCKSMNEPHFFFFMLYMVDLYNLKMEKKLRVMACPKVRCKEEANGQRQKALEDVKVTLKQRIVGLLFIFFSTHLSLR